MREMTFTEQLLHIADNMNWLSSTYLFTNAPVKRDPAIKLSKAEVLKVLAEAYDRGLQGHNRTSKMQLEEHVKFCRTNDQESDFNFDAWPPNSPSRTKTYRLLAS